MAALVLIGDAAGLLRTDGDHIGGRQFVLAVVGVDAEGGRAAVGLHGRLIEDVSVRCRGGLRAGTVAVRHGDVRNRRGHASRNQVPDRHQH